MKYKKKPKNIFNNIMNIFKIKKATKSERKLKFIKHTKEKHKKRFEKNKKINKAKDRKNIIKKLFFIAILILFYLFYIKNITLNNSNELFNNKNKKRVGVVCIDNSHNVGNILVKYSMFKKLEELGFNATIITPGKFGKKELSFINNTFNPNLFLINKNFSEELNERQKIGLR